MTTEQINKLKVGDHVCWTDKRKEQYIGIVRNIWLPSTPEETTVLAVSWNDGPGEVHANEDQLTPYNK